MNFENAKEVFTQFLDKEKVVLSEASPIVCIEKMLEFYSQIRFDGVDLDDDGDMLLFQYGGPYGWEPEFFVLDITRQFMSSEDGTISQLSLSYKYKVKSNEMKDEHWCYDLSEVEAFSKYIKTSEVINWIQKHKADKFSLEYSKI